MPKTITFPAHRDRVCLYAVRRNSFRPTRRDPQNLIGSQGQMMADDHADFAVGQDGGVGLNAQNIGSGTGGNLEYKKFKQFLLNSIAQFTISCLHFRSLA